MTLPEKQSIDGEREREKTVLFLTDFSHSISQLEMKQVYLLLLPCHTLIVTLRINYHLAGVTPMQQEQVLHIIILV